MTATPPTHAAFYHDLRHRLRAAGVADPDLTARLFLREATGRKDILLETAADAPIPPATAAAIEGWAARRIAGEPVNRILGTAEFHGLTFEVTPDVLDPRQDTETLVDRALALFRERGQPPARILDLGTGSGCIIITLLHYWPEARGVAVDLSEKALAVAARNAARNAGAERLELRQGNWFAPVSERFELIVTNPPYIPNHDIANLQKEVREHDPILALDGGEDGFFSIRNILTEIENHLSPQGICLMEIGFDQGENIARLVGESGLSTRALHLDLSGVPRIVEIASGEN
jgi:release factor glutamine methyltransferase